MIIKNPKPVYKRWLKRGAVTLFVIEAVCFAGSYFVWHRINTERDYRRYLHDNFPFILEGFYKTGELFDSKSNLRQLDQASWEKEQN